MEHSLSSSPKAGLQVRGALLSLVPLWSWQTPGAPCPLIPRRRLQVPCAWYPDRRGDAGAGHSLTTGPLAEGRGRGGGVCRCSLSSGPKSGAVGAGTPSPLIFRRGLKVTGSPFPQVPWRGCSGQTLPLLWSLGGDSGGGSLSAPTAH